MKCPSYFVHDPKDIILESNDNACLLAFDYMLNNNKDIDSKMVLQLSLPVKIELYTHDNEKPKNKEAIDNKLSKLL